MVEEYNEYGEIIQKKPKPVIYKRKLNTQQQHRIHETKDLFESNCYLCRKVAEKYQSHWKDHESL